MKRLFKNFRIWNLMCVIFIISILCLRAFCVSAATAAAAASSSDHRKNDPVAEERIGGVSVTSSRPTAGQPPDAIKDLAERKARNYVSDEETPKEMPTKVKIVGDLGTPPPNSNIKLGFVPRQTYVQVRRYDTEVHLPRSAAVAEAETAEEVANAPRLREVVSHTKKQEVYEEQGYEDTAYDHGGYKKAGEHHEKKIIPREQKTDYSHITDQSTEAAQIVKIGRYSTTESSQPVTKLVTSTEPSLSRRPKRPKSQRGVAWLRHRQASENQEKSGTQSTTNTPKNEEKIPPHKRRKPKTSKSSSAAHESKVMDESKLISTRRSINELDIKPTTYHPPLPRKFFRPSKLYAKKASLPAKKKHFFKLPLISREGYKFEDPFDSFKDFSAVRMVTHPSVTKTKTRTLPEAKYASYFYPTQYRINDVPMSLPLFDDDRESRETGKVQPALVLIKPTKLPQITAQYNMNELPASLKPAVQVLVKPVQQPNYSPQYRMNEMPLSLPLANNYGVNQPTTVMVIRPAKEPENEYYRKIKNFPYEIVESLKKPWSEKILDSFKPWSEMPKNEKHIRVNFPYKIVKTGNANKKPIYEAKKSKKASSISMFGQPDTSPWIPLMPKDIYDIHGYNIKRTTPKAKKVIETEPGLEKKYSKKLAQPIRVYDHPKVVATSYKIHHVYKPDKGETDVETTAGSTPNAESSNTRVTVSPDNYLTSSEVKPNYDIITAHSSDVRNTFTPSRASSTSTSKPAQLSSTLKPEENVTTKDRESLEEIEMLSSSRYSVFHRMNATTPIESTTASLKDVNDEFNRLFIDEQEKLLFRHPHLPRETSGLMKMPLDEDDSIKNTTTTTSKRDIVLTNLKNGSITHLTKVSKRDNNYSYVKPFIVYPQDYASSAKYVERLTAAHYSSPENVALNPPPLDYQQRIVSLTNHLKNDTIRLKRQVDETDVQLPEQEMNEELVTLSISGSTTEIPVNVKKYPFYKMIPSRGLSKYSVLRYISNPKDIPTKRNGKMSFYESRKEVECEEPQPPEQVVPQREEGEWAYNPKPKLPRVQLGDKITCLKMKFFGSDPLDNPFFKEETIGYPEVLKRPSYQVTEKPEQSARIKGQQSSESSPKKSTKPRKKRRPRQTDQLFSGTTSSPVRRWIESLAQRPSRIFKRAALENFKPSNDEETKQKVIVIGGFINRGNLKERPQKKMERILHTESPLKADSSSENEISRTESMTDFNYQQAKRFNEELAFTSEPLSLEEEDDKSNAKTHYADTTTVRSAIVEGHSKYLPVASRILSGKKKKNYVDALESLRNLQNSSATTAIPTDSTVEPRPSLQYKEPTWRYKKPEPTSGVPLQDSLLYVIHPNGEGRWMKLVRVEDMSDDPRLIKSDNSVGSSNSDLQHLIPITGFPTTASSYGPQHIPPPVHYPNSAYWYENQANDQNAPDQRVPCQHTGKEDNEASPNMDYDVYHISGLLKQVAPLKASEAEINNLQTTNEDEIAHEDDIISNSYYGLSSLRGISSTQFPEPHERLYYYVLDDEETGHR